MRPSMLMVLSAGLILIFSGCATSRSSQRSSAEPDEHHAVIRSECFDLGGTIIDAIFQSSPGGHAVLREINKNNVGGCGDFRIPEGPCSLGFSYEGDPHRSSRGYIRVMFDAQAKHTYRYIGQAGLSEWGVSVLDEDHPKDTIASGKGELR